MPPPDAGLAARAAHLLQPPSALAAAYALCHADAYDKASNPEGYINLGTAQNHLLWDVLQPALCAPRAMQACDTHYGPMYGSARLRGLLTAFLQRRSQRTLHPEHLVVASGAAACIDMLAWVLFEPKDGILLASPYYAGFDFALQARAGLDIVAVPTQAQTGFAPTVAQLREAYVRAQQRGIAVRGMLIANPHNPTGMVADAAQMRAWLDFAQQHDLQVIVDEIYAHSIYGKTDFVSCLQTATPHVHTIYGLAKDFALAGFKVGMIYPGNAQVLAACKALAYLSPVATDTQATLCQALETPGWLQHLLTLNGQRLAHAHARAAAAIERMGAAAAPAQAGLFSWVDLRPFLKDATFAGEVTLHQALLHGARLNLSPGAAFHSPEPGWFRLCFACPDAVLDAGLQRLATALHASATRNFSATGVYAQPRA